MNSSDWIQMTGHPVVGRGGRPIHPRYLAMKARPGKSSALARQTRRLILRAAQLNGEVDNLLSSATSYRRFRTAPRDTSIAEQSKPGAAGAVARLRHQAAVQRARKF